MLLTDEIMRDAYIASGLWGNVTLDDMISRWASARAAEPAVSDGQITLTWQALETAVNKMATRLSRAGLEQDDAIATQSGNCVSAIVSFLGILRARMIAVPLPTLWDHNQTTRALTQIAPRAIIAGEPCPHRNFAENACQSATDVVSIRQVFGFGNSLPDGMVDLSGVFGRIAIESGYPQRRTNEPEHVATMCWWQGPDALPRIVPRSHNHWFAAGLGPVAESRINAKDVLLSGQFLTNTGAIGSVLVPWLLSGCKLKLFEPPSSIPLAELCQQSGATILVIPGAVIGNIKGLGSTDLRRIMCLWPNLQAAHLHRNNADTAPGLAMTDIFFLGEQGLYARPRHTDVKIGNLTLGRIPLPGGGDDPPCLLETRIKGKGHRAANNDPLLSGELQVSGPMVPPPFMSGSQSLGVSLDEKTNRFVDGFAGTELTAKIANPSPPSFVPVDFEAGVIATGGVRHSVKDLETDYIKVEAIQDVAVFGTEEPVFGQKIAAQIVSEWGSGADPRIIRADLLASGIAEYRLPDVIYPVSSIKRDKSGAPVIDEFSGFAEQIAG